VNRRTRRANTAITRKKLVRRPHAPPHLVAPAAHLEAEQLAALLPHLMAILTSSMAKRGPEMRRELMSRVAGEPTSGHKVDLLMASGAVLERSMLELNAADFMDAAAVILSIARDLAYAEGKIRQGPPIPDA
jgi:hypothetical protein